MAQDLAALSALSIRSAFDQSFASLRVLLDKGHIQSFLVVLYSTIDAAAWLSVEHGGDVTKKDFVRWVDEYLLPQSGLDCSALDLYAARCGVLHSFSAYSALQRKGKARPISYALGSGSLPALRRLIAVSDEKEAVAVQLEDLANAVVRGWERFHASIESNPRTLQRLTVRGGMLFSLVGQTAGTPHPAAIRPANG
ncbi:MAG: hypothetical protein WD771_05075 [Gemmatimonadaceae bacterium]